MASKKSLTLSLVIPAYNEENHLKACLDAIAKQTVMPREVIVVDNNSTDRTVDIARDYPFVTLLTETKQHQVFAQAKGFDKAISPVIARIDADTILPPDWTRNVLATFSKQPDIIAITGGGVPYDVPLKKAGMAIFRFYHETFACLLAGHIMLWGSNMAFRASSWPQLKKVMHFRPDLWEDYDMSFHLVRLGRLYYDERLEISCSFRAAHKSLVHQFRYQLRSIRTFAVHTSLLRTTVFAIVWSTLLIFYPIPFIDRYLWRWQHWRQSTATKRH